MKEDNKILISIIIIVIIAVIIIYVSPPRISESLGSEKMCIERHVEPCKDHDCGSYNLSIFDHIVDCKFWSEENNYGHDGVHWCIEKFQRLDGNCTKWIEVFR